MKKNVTMGVLAALAMSGVFGSVSFAADKAADARPAVTTEAKAAPAAEKKVSGKKAKKTARKTKKAAAKAEATPEAGK
ncbi:MAG TPA: hypothetical protein VN371_04690 [Chlorobaculum sp.]|nr:hypothetical protein [Chlorobaculum sp.]